MPYDCLEITQIAGCRLHFSFYEQLKSATSTLSMSLGGL